LGKEDVILVHPKMASTASSSTGALVAAGSLQPRKPRLLQVRSEARNENLFNRAPSIS